MANPIYKRVVLKISGEALKNNHETDILDFDFVDKVVESVRKCLEAGVEVAIIVGAGNIWRGARKGVGMNRTRADHMGMLATVINALALQDAFLRHNIDARVLSTVEMNTFADFYTQRDADRLLSEGKVVIFGGGSGMAYFSTDTPAVVRAAEVGADAVLMAKNVDYIYTDDPRKNPDAVKLERVKATEVLAMNLKAIDATATAFSLSTGVPVHVFGLKDPSDIEKAVRGEVNGTVISAE